MIARLTSTLVGVALCGVAATASAAPVQVNYVDINAATIEDFESLFGDQGTSKAFDGFTASVSEGNLFVSGSDSFCETSPDRCLTNQNATEDTRTFDGFAASTNWFGFELTPIADEDPSPTENIDVFEVVVTGGSGSATFSLSGNGLFGFGDTDGLTSVAITNLGDDGDGTAFSNYGIDDVITGASLEGDSPISAIPLPASALLLASALGALGVSRRGRRT